MQPVTPRQSDILQHARSAGRVTVDSLAESFGVTPQTIRKDLNELCDKGLLQRVHGGAVLAAGLTNYAYDSRRTLAAEEKRLIGLAAAKLIPENCSVFINIGTTTEQVAYALGGHRGLMVVTNNINVANILRNSPGVEVIISGGIVRPADGGIVGEAAVDFIRQFRCDFAVIGTSAIDADGTLLDYDFREVKVAQAIIESARHILLVADSMKLSRSAPVRIAHLSQVETFVTDKPPPPAIARICAENKVEVVVAASEQATGEQAGEREPA